MSIRLGLTRKLVLAFVFKSALVIAMLTGIMHWDFERGFLDYVQRLELNRLNPLAEDLVELYARHGGWDGIVSRPARWRQLLRRGTGAAAQAPSPSPIPATPLAVPAENSGPRIRLALLDSDKSHLIGRQVPGPDDLLRPLRHRGELIGWLRLAPLPGLIDALDLEFQQRQRHTIVLTALIALILSVLISIPLARHLLGPIRGLLRNLKKLTQGHFTSRSRIERNDELGELASGVDRLGETLERNEGLRRRWVADVSHELRTPLAVLTGDIDAVADGIRPWNAETRDSLQAEVGYLNKLVDDLYQLALSDLGALNYRKQDLELEAIIGAVIERRRADCAERAIELSVELSEPATPLSADPGRLNQLFDNLFQNSLRYTDPGGRLRISTRRRDDWILIDFQDSAPGVPPDTLPQLFERLFRVDKSRSRAQGGAGLGLAICRNIVQAHQGHIRAQASPLGGLWIEIQLPISHN